MSRRKNIRLTIRFSNVEMAIVEELQKGAEKFLGIEFSKAEAVRTALRILKELAKEQAKRFGLPYLPVGIFFLSPKQLEDYISKKR